MIPCTGLIKLIPKSIFCLLILDPDLDETVTALYVGFTIFFSYNPATHSSIPEKAFNSVEYFSETVIESMLLLFLMESVLPAFLFSFAYKKMAIR